MHPALLVPRLTGFDREVVGALAASGPSTQAKLLVRLRGVSQATLSRAMKRLADQGIVEKGGATRDAMFRLSPAAEHFARPPHLRPVARYDRARIDGYEPNKTRWLPREAEDRMRQAAGRVAHQLDASTYSRRIAERFLIDLSWASSHLEGNTYKYLEAEALIKYAETAEGHDWTEATMILNHKRAIGLLLEAVDTRGITPEWTARLHSLLMRDLVPAEALGRVRSRGDEYGIGGSSYRPSSDPVRLAEDQGALCWAAERVENPFEASFLLMAGTAYLQAFHDGNKRTGRLACNLPLLRAGLPPMSFMAVTPSEYITGAIAFYELGDPAPLADVLSRAYAEAAPHYSAAVATQRAPRSAEIRHRGRINAAIAALMEEAVAGRPREVAAYAAEALADLPEQDRGILEANIAAALAAIGPHNHDAWEADRRLVEAFAEWRASDPPADAVRP